MGGEDFNPKKIYIKKQQFEFWIYVYYIISYILGYFPNFPM